MGDAGIDLEGHQPQEPARHPLRLHRAAAFHHHLAAGVRKADQPVVAGIELGRDGQFDPGVLL
jgi:hypothetical protein